MNFSTAAVKLKVLAGEGIVFPKTCRSVVNLRKLAGDCFYLEILDRLINCFLFSLSGPFRLVKSVGKGGSFFPFLLGVGWCADLFARPWASLRAKSLGAKSECQPVIDRVQNLEGFNHEFRKMKS